MHALCALRSLTGVLALEQARTGAVFMSAFTTKTAVYVLLRAFTGFEILGVMGTLMTLYGISARDIALKG